MRYSLSNVHEYVDHVFRESEASKKLANRRHNSHSEEKSQRKTDLFIGSPPTLRNEVIALSEKKGAAACQSERRSQQVMEDLARIVELEVENEHTVAALKLKQND